MQYFENLFGPRENSKTIYHKNLTRGAIQILLNELFSLDENENEGIKRLRKRE